MRHGPPTPYLAIRAPHLAPTCTCSCARAPRAPPALRPVLPGTRPRKRRRGPFGPEVEKSSGATPSGRRPCRENPSRAAQPRPIGTGTCGGAARSQRAQDLAERPKPARAVEKDLRGHAWHGAFAGTFQHCDAARSRAPAPRGLQLSMNYSLISVRSHLISTRRISSSKPSAPAAY